MRRPNNELRFVQFKGSIEWTVGQWDCETFGEQSAHWIVLGSDELYHDEDFNIGDLIPPPQGG